ncbi:MAG: hypothetical protein ACRD3G_18920 [Vicinamibacterales bacterium]
MRKLAWLGILAAAITLSIYVTPTVSGQQQALPRPYGAPPPMVITAFGGKAVTYKAPRTPWGDPDLQGVWSSDDMEGVPIGANQGGRGGRGGAPGAAAGGLCGNAPLPPCPTAAPTGPPPPLYRTEEELEARRKQVSTQADNRDRNSTSTFRNDYARRAFPQTRLVVDPPDGRVPTVLPGARIMPRGTNGAGPINSWLDFPLYERCITRGIGGSVLRVIYGNGNRIVQGPGVVAFSYEMLPDTRIFHTDNRQHVNQKIGMYLGNSTSRWEGEELVVETTNLTDQTAFGVNGLGTQHSKAMKITERFRRVADDVIQYQATWDDPLTYSTPFTVSFPLTPLDGGMLLPYDCHEGNKAVEMTLAAERDEDRTMAEAAAKGIKRERRPINQNAGGAGRGAGAGRGGRGEANTGEIAEK